MTARAANDGGRGWQVAQLALSLVMLAGMLLFAYSAVDILRIETSPGAATTTAEDREIPPTAWPGIALFFGAGGVLQGARLWRVRAAARAGRATAAVPREATDERPDGPPRADALYGDHVTGTGPADTGERED